MLGLFLRMAECLERSQQQTVTGTKLVRRSGKRVELMLTLSRPSPIELLSIEDCRAAFKKTFDLDFRVKATVEE